MTIDKIYLGTWLPRTHLHLMELYDFFNDPTHTSNHDKEKLKEFHTKLGIISVEFQGNPNFNSIKLLTKGITTTITEDGIILLMVDSIDNINQNLKNLEEFFSEKLGPAIAYIFSRGAPLPQTLKHLKEVYPRIFVGKNITTKDAEEIFHKRGVSLLTSKSTEDIKIFYGRDIDILSLTSNVKPKDFDDLIENAVFTNAFLELLKRYLHAHREIWEDISTIRLSKNTSYKEFPLIRERILDSLQTISFIKTRLQQMKDIHSARNHIISAGIKHKLTELGFENFKILESSSLYFENLWQMTEDYANSTLTLFESLVEENAQREIRLLQQVTVLGAIVGFFGMNIAFPWEERWPDVFVSSFVILVIIVALMGSFYLIIKFTIQNRRFDISRLEKPQSHLSHL